MVRPRHPVAAKHTVTPSLEIQVITFREPPDRTPNQHSAKGYNKLPPGKENEKDDQDRAIQRVLTDLYSLKRPVLQTNGYRGLGAPL